MNRRQFATTGGSALVVAVAGCAGTDTDSGDGGDPAASTDDASGDSPRFGDAFVQQTSFAYTGQYSAPENGGDATIEGRVYDDDLYMRTEMDGQVFEQYVIDGVSYIVSDGQCFENPSTDVEPDEPEQEPGSFDEDADRYAERAPDGITTVNNEEAYYWEIDDGDEQVTYYVSVSGGRLLRVEFPEGQIDYHSWGSADPITPPDMECLSF